MDTWTRGGLTGTLGTIQLRNAPLRSWFGLAADVVLPPATFGQVGTPYAASIFGIGLDKLSPDINDTETLDHSHQPRTTSHNVGYSLDTETRLAIRPKVFWCW